jgi:signal transduction histidine kinase/CheY-like chemotaxis protein
LKNPSKYNFIDTLQIENIDPEIEVILNSLLNLNFHPVLITGKKGHIVYTNKAGMELVKPVNRSFLSRPIDDFISFDKDVHDEIINCQVKQETKIKYPAFLKNNKTKLLHSWKSIITKNNKVFFINIFEDTSEINKLKKRIKSQNTLLKSILSNTEELTFTLSVNGLVDYLSPSCSKILNKDNQYIIGMHFLDILDTNSRKEFKSAFNKKNIIKNFQHKFQIDDNTTELFQSNIQPFYKNDNVLAGYCVSSRNIDKFIELENKLEQTQKMETIGGLAGGIAHDFNNILFPIMGHTEMLLEDIPKDNPIQKRLKGIYNASLRAKNLVKQILIFSRQERSEKKQIKMQPIIKEALKLIRSTIPSTIEIKYDIQKDCCSIKADPIHIHQIVMNLATNAYHAMEETGGELIFNLKQIELSEPNLNIPDLSLGVYACLTILDTGKGIDKEVKQKMFDPFFTTKKPGKGTGMGLSVVYGIVTEMKGAIDVKSKQGKGTKFHVYLPESKETKVKEPTHPIKLELPCGIEHILLVDDEVSIVQMEKNMLERLGYKVTAHSSSIDALETFRKTPGRFDMVITDMAMPKMSGDKLSTEVNKICPGTPVLLCTGFSETMSEEKAATLGINGFLLKPFVMKDLAQKIREILDNNKAII